MQFQPSRSLQENLALRFVESDADAEKVISVNAEIHGADAGAVIRYWLFAGHPILSRSDFLFIEDRTTGRAVATLAFLPTIWHYGGQPLPVAELGFVATLPDYRRRSLQRHLSSAFDELALAQGYTLAAIEGIPGFYGQFGYEYAVPLNHRVDLEFRQISDDPGSTGYNARAATLEDVSALQQLYDASISDLDVAAQRDAALWTHQLAASKRTNFCGTTTIFEHEGKVVGYLRWNDDEWSDRLRILELAVSEGPGARERILAALRFARDKGESGAKGGLRLQLHLDHPAAVVARYLGAVDRGHYGWQMKVLGPVGFMQLIGSALERRLEASLLAESSVSLVFDLYRSRLYLGFKRGKLVEIDQTGDSVEADAGMTLKQATQLWLGWRGRKELEAWYPDFWSREHARQWIDVLFPEARACIYMPY